MDHLRVCSSGSFTLITIMLFSSKIFSMEMLIIVISKDKWISRNRTTIDRDENSFFIALH